MFGMGNFPDMFNLVANTILNQPTSILNSSEEVQKNLVKQALDIANFLKDY